ncbi:MULTISPECIES: tRNA (adenosine(37)-N6)-threonylcarbamoyltransferase complex dimerization subunit type 1 TsaB [Clostridium]|uniref:tRNA threonylcarbamoyl adenosine modification protein YeaZ n=1 Tax=Clostridium cadaveris TaxID=1529 RepID=A0A1I2LHJ8_9CLOT|nr:tRNA (adenosine(37)-N6)-threonylcarbamoyltransferase complex dimerization subunit type 1 TsaB [Clostridium cadaveris]MDU4951423.1 tRNA (adenosine(37)-N6)-threonylcarbamoyltransferase complex dimerization subunit type 1 TsaB [Clostridium sp.]MDM8310693.1 tRNA (adenosine(37)-N6)-threonylcarbamoyltransferase complex dimerization subunit type 1 TsaB [Clostridium cadaveris]MDY4950705.1 tRNA (adenosine(37)-N6)-threonylcarbamoyltransferase complex dimerization subunit type 1 TsaB [Clostridium cadave
MIVLSIDSATDAATAAVVSNDQILGEMNFANKKQHSVLIMPMIDELLKSLDLTIDDIEGFVISKGPGSFTGLRIGMATIKGLSLGSSKPYVSISSLDSLAYNLYGANGIVCPIMDALRENVYCGLYKFENGEMIKLMDYDRLSLDELVSKLKEFNEPVYFVGDGTKKYGELLKNSLENCFFAPNNLNYTRASSLGELGIKLLSQGISDDINISNPLYLRKSQAEREYDEKLKKGL